MTSDIFLLDVYGSCIIYGYYLLFVIIIIITVVSFGKGEEVQHVQVT